MRGPALLTGWLEHLLSSPRGRRAFKAWATSYSPAEWLGWVQGKTDLDDYGLALDALLELQGLLIVANQLYLDKHIAKLEAQLLLEEDGLFKEQEESGGGDAPAPEGNATPPPDRL